MKKHSSRRISVYDVAIAGAGPAGSIMAWALARHGANVLLLDRAQFPREKVCGDFIEPRGLRILQKTGCLAALEEAGPLPITHVAMFLQSRCAYKGKIPFYDRQQDLPPHGYIIPRLELDYLLLQSAVKAGAVVREESTIKSVIAGENDVKIKVQRKSRQSTYSAKLIVGADGVNSIVARSMGLLADDPRYTSVSKRAYAEGIEEGSGESAFFFDEDMFPGYGWMFPMADGKANIGVGVLAEAQKRYNIHIPRLFNDFIEKIRRVHPRCADLSLSSRPIGGVVKTYGGAGRNYFKRGILIGDAGSFIDPMTGEGITSAMESALIGSSVLIASLEQGRFDSAFLSSYEKQFRQYFDPSMLYVDLCAAMMRNRCFKDSWLKIVAHGCKFAKNDREFARVAGATFGGMEVKPRKILTQVWIKAIGELNPLFNMINGDIKSVPTTVNDLFGWQVNWWKSIISDPLWHTGWTSDVFQKWLKVIAISSRSDEDPRMKGLSDKLY